MIRRIALLSVLVALLAEATFVSAGKRRSYVIKDGDTPVGVAKKFGLDVDELLRYNNLKPGGSFLAGETLTIPFPGEVTGSTYTVQPGDSVASIADFHGVSQDDLRAANGLKPDENVSAGQALAIPHELRGGTSKGYVIREGDTLASVAKKHGVTAAALAKANKLSKESVLKLGRTLVIPDEDDGDDSTYRPKKSGSSLVKSGEIVPGGVRHTVQPGQSIWTIARAYNSSGEKIAQANGISTDKPLSIGQKILIPGAGEVVPVRVKGFVIQPIQFLRVRSGERASLKLVANSGKINQRSRQILSKLAGPKDKSKRTKPLHPRLLHLIQRVAERYPGQTIEIVSGYRPKKRGASASKHTQGRAIDFRVSGVDDKELYEFIKQLPNVGAGYYPNSVFVHMDARDETVLWTDISGPGQKSVYAKPGERDPEATSDAQESVEQPLNP